MVQRNKPDLAAFLQNRKSLEQITGSSDAQALASIIKKDHNQTELENMAKQAMGGDTAAIQSLVQSITASPEGTELLRRLQKNFDNR